MKKPADQKPVLLVALGGNALIRKGQSGSVDEQFENLKIPMTQIARLSREYRIIITHGNGPQVGNLLLQQECCDTVPRLPLEILVAQTQGQIGYMIESTLDEALMSLGVNNQLRGGGPDRQGLSIPLQAGWTGLYPGKGGDPALPHD